MALAQGSKPEAIKNGVMRWQYSSNITKTHKPKLVNPSRVRPGFGPLG